MHAHVGVRQSPVDLLDDAHDQDVAGRLRAELVGAVTRADSDRQRIDTRPGHELLRLGGIRQVLAGLLAAEARPVTVLDTSQAAQLSLDGDSFAVRGPHDLRGHLHVVLVRAGLFGVFAQ